MKIAAIPLAGLAAIGIALAVACGGSTTASATDTDSGASDAGIDASACAPIGTTRSCHTCPPDSVGGVGVDAGPPLQDTNCLAPQLKIGLQGVSVVL